MCSSRYFDVFAVTISLLSGIAMAILSVFGLLSGVPFIALLGLGLSALALLLLTIGTASLLRQNDCYDRCIYFRGKRLLIAALLLLIVSAFALVFTLSGVLVTAALVFLIYTLFALTIFTLYCFLSCLIGAGHENN